MLVLDGPQPLVKARPIGAKVHGGNAHQPRICQQRPDQRRANALPSQICANHHRSQPWAKVSTLRIVVLDQVDGASQLPVDQRNQREWYLVRFGSGLQVRHQVVHTHAIFNVNPELFVNHPCNGINPFRVIKEGRDQHVFKKLFGRSTSL